MSRMGKRPREALEEDELDEQEDDQETLKIHIKDLKTVLAELKALKAEKDTSSSFVIGFLRSLFGYRDSLTEDDNIQNKLETLLGDVVKEDWRRYRHAIGPAHEFVTVYEYAIPAPMEIDDLDFERLSAIPEVASVQLQYSKNEGEILLQVHTTSDPDIHGRYLQNEIPFTTMKTQGVIHAPDEVVACHFDVDHDVHDIFNVKFGRTEHRKRIDIHTIPVKLPIYVSQVLSIKAYKRFYRIRFSPHATSRACLMTFELLAFKSNGGNGLISNTQSSKRQKGNGCSELSECGGGGGGGVETGVTASG